MKAYRENDIVKYKEEDKNQAIDDLPVALETVNNDMILWKESTSEYVDARNETTFFIDDNGGKHLQNYAANAVKVTGTFDLNRRGGPNDAVQRSTGSWITDGFTVGSWVSFEGTTNEDSIAFKVIAVSALDLEFDESIQRISIDELAVSCTVHQGWQRLENVDFEREMNLKPSGQWAVKADGKLKTEAYDKFVADLANVVKSFTNTSMPMPEAATIRSLSSRPTWYSVLRSPTSTSRTFQTPVTRARPKKGHATRLKARATCLGPSSPRRRTVGTSAPRTI